jgi:hypothetical protein
MEKCGGVDISVCDKVPHIDQHPPEVPTVKGFTGVQKALSRPYRHFDIGRGLWHCLHL